MKTGTGPSAPPPGYAPVQANYAPPTTAAPAGQPPAAVMAQAIRGGTPADAYDPAPEALRQQQQQAIQAQMAALRQSGADTAARFAQRNQALMTRNAANPRAAIPTTNPYESKKNMPEYRHVWNQWETQYNPNSPNYNPQTTNNPDSPNYREDPAEYARKQLAQQQQMRERMQALKQSSEYQNAPRYKDLVNNAPSKQPDYTTIDSKDPNTWISTSPNDDVSYARFMAWRNSPEGQQFGQPKGPPPKSQLYLREAEKMRLRDEQRAAQQLAKNPRGTR